MLLRHLLLFVLAFTPTRAWSTNGFCEEHRLELIPIYQTLIERLKQHLYTRDNNLKIDAETDIQAFMKFSQQADRYDKRMVNAIRAYNDDDPEAERVCRALVVSANCEAYLVYQDAVINLPGIERESVLAEGRRRCERAYQYIGFSFVPDGVW
ncbi:hypothetical protein [Magnetospirillum sp. UT-4]|uniref:hypothetical protein n=1 Tax=Magnetospirillum sp. UT-4 TaxID=2681467 RepID=UPI001381B920|nr:hypothetical protein [Magnetospirillum sp. UT-4]CAA7615012.1 exported hypothetical protein [Magnetospirillum sp. UT-4]